MVFDPDNYVEPEKTVYLDYTVIDEHETQDEKSNRILGIERYWESGRLRLRRIKK